MLVTGRGCNAFWTLAKEKKKKRDGQQAIDRAGRQIGSGEVRESGCAGDGRRGGLMNGENSNGKHEISFYARTVVAPDVFFETEGEEKAAQEREKVRIPSRCSHLPHAGDVLETRHEGRELAIQPARLQLPGERVRHRLSSVPENNHENARATTTTRTCLRLASD